MRLGDAQHLGAAKLLPLLLPWFLSWTAGMLLQKCPEMVQGQHGPSGTVPSGQSGYAIQLCPEG